MCKRRHFDVCDRPHIVATSRTSSEPQYHWTLGECRKTKSTIPVKIATYRSGQIFFSFCYNPHVWQTDRRTDRQLSPVCLSRHSSCLRGIHDLREACSSASTSAISTLVCVHLCLHISIPYATIIPAAVDFDRPTSLRVRGFTNSHRSGRSILCCCVYGTTLTPRTSEFRRLPKTHLCAEDHSHYVLLILFIYLIYQSTAWQSKNNKHQINAIPGLNGQCRDSPLKHGQHKG